MDSPGHGKNYLKGKVMTFTHPPRLEKREISIPCPYCGKVDLFFLREGKHVLTCSKENRDFVVEIFIEIKFKVFVLKEDL